jgi:hypothetical protein
MTAHRNLPVQLPTNPGTDHPAFICIENQKADQIKGDEMAEVNSKHRQQKIHPKHL